MRHPTGPIRGSNTRRDIAGPGFFLRGTLVRPESQGKGVSVGLPLAEVAKAVAAEYNRYEPYTLAHLEMGLRPRLKEVSA